MIPAADLARELGVAEGDVQTLERMIATATATLGRELGRFLGEPEETVETQRGGRSLIVLYDEPVAVGEQLEPEVEVESRQSISDPWEPVDADDYSLEGQKLRHVSCWPRYVKVTYSRGFNTGDGPLELAGVVRRMVETAWEEANDDGTTKKSESLGDHSWTFADVSRAAPDAWENFARRWRRLRA